MPMVAYRDRAFKVRLLRVACERSAAEPREFYSPQAHSKFGIITEYRESSDGKAPRVLGRESRECASESNRGAVSLRRGSFRETD